MVNDNIPPDGTDDAYDVIHKAVTTLQDAGVGDNVIATNLLGEGLFLKLRLEPSVGKIIDEIEVTLGIISEHVSDDDKR